MPSISAGCMRKSEPFGLLSVDVHMEAAHGEM